MFEEYVSGAPPTPVLGLLVRRISGATPTPVLELLVRRISGAPPTPFLNLLILSTFAATVHSNQIWLLVLNS